MKYINKQRKPKAIWGTLIQAGIGLGTSVVGSLIEKEKMRQQMDVENKTKYDTEYNNQLANDKLLANNYQFKGNSNMKTYFKKGGRINRRFTKGGTINKLEGYNQMNDYSEQSEPNKIDFMSEVDIQRNYDLQNAPLRDKQVESRNNYNTSLIADPTGDKTYTYQKQNGKWVAYNTNNGKSFNLSDNPKYKSTIDVLEGRIKPISKSSTKSTKSSTPTVSNPKSKVAEIVASPINKSNNQPIYNQYKEYYSNIDKNGFPKSPNSPTPYINRPRGGKDNQDVYNRMFDMKREEEDKLYYQREKNKKRTYKIQ